MDITERDLLLLSELKNLLQAAPATEICRSLEEFLSGYLTHGGVIQPTREMVCHIHFLMLFFREVE